MRNEPTARESKAFHQGPNTMLSMTEVAKRLGVSLSLAHKLVRTGQLESYRFGRCRRVSERQLQTYLEACLTRECPEIVNRRLKHF